MRGKLRRAWFLTLASSLLLYVSLGAPVVAAEPRSGPAFDGTAEIDGPVQLQVNVTPPVARPRDRVTVELTLTSQRSEPVAPAVEITLPDVLASTLPRYPAATTFDAQHNQLIWQPILSGDGDSEKLSLEYSVAVADILRPEQQVNIQLRYDGVDQGASVSFWVGSPPSATIKIDNPVVAVGQPVKLQAAAAGPGPFTQTWYLSDGRHIVANDPEVSFALPGIYEVRLQVANPLDVATAISAVTVVSQPTALFTVDDELPIVGQTVKFMNASGGERPLQSHWYFGDGAESQEASPSHVYTAPGTYIVRLVVTSVHGQSEITAPLSVGADPVADMVLPEQAQTGAPVQVMGFGDDSVMSLQWDMGDGRSYEGDVVTHTYYRPGDFTVTLLATNEYGETAVRRQIRVEGDLYTVFLPYARGLALESLDDDADGDGGVGELPAASEAGGIIADEPANLDTPQGLVEQSGSTVPVPGATPGTEPGAIGEPPALGGGTSLPPQTPLAEDATAPEQLLWYVNEARRLHGLHPLTYNYELSIAAQHHTADMAGNPEIMHIGTDGSRPAERQQRFGYLGSYGGEAVAWGWESPVPVVEFWVNSPPHRVLILNPQADEIGVGFTADGFAPNIWYWTVEFGILP